MSGTIVLRRGEVVESRHRIHAAVTDAEGRVLARVGDPRLATHFRSAAKPLQALPLVADGALKAFGIPGEELALACASHSGEAAHVEGVRRLLERCGVPESALELGPHPPLRAEAARELLRDGEDPRPIHNNCSGKHAAMLALARHRGWPLEGYRLADHPVQRRMLDEIARWTGLDPARIRVGVDGCGVVCFAVTLRDMARSFAALGGAAARGEAAPRAVVEAMVGHPFHVAGTARLCTELMSAAGEVVFAKVGAEGVYCAGDREGAMGIALKVEDGGRRASEVALVRILEQLGLLGPELPTELERYRRREVPNTRGEAAAVLEADVGLTWLAGERAAGAVSGPTDGPHAGPAPAGALPPPVRALVRVSGALASGDTDRIRDSLEDAARHSPAREVEEVLVQSYLFLGFPAALNGLALWREVRDEEPPEREDADREPAPRSPPDWDARGEAVCRKVYGDRYEALRENIRFLHPDLDRWMVREGYGKVLGRPGLELAVRELCVVALLAVLDAPVQLYSHLRGALSVGAREEEVEGALAAVEDLMDPEARERAWSEWKRVRGRAGTGGRSGPATER